CRARNAARSGPCATVRGARTGSPRAKHTQIAGKTRWRSGSVSGPVSGRVSARVSAQFREARPARLRIIDAMPALAELDPTRADALQDVVPEPEAAAEVTEAPSAELSTQGAVPDVDANGNAIEPGQTASEQAFGDKPTAQSGQIDGGMFIPTEYQAACF